MLHHAAPGIGFIGEAASQNRLMDDFVKLNSSQSSGELFDFAQGVQESMHPDCKLTPIGSSQVSTGQAKSFRSGNVMCVPYLLHGFPVLSTPSSRKAPGRIEDVAHRPRVGDVQPAFPAVRKTKPAQGSSRFS